MVCLCRSFADEIKELIIEAVGPGKGALFRDNAIDVADGKF